MGVVILAIISLIAAAILIDMAVEKYRRACYVIYRYCGSICLILAITWLPICITDKGLNLLLFPVLVVIGGISYLIWLAKVAALCIHSPSRNWVMITLKVYFWILCVVVFPLGILAEYMHQCFSINSLIKNKHRKQE